MDKIRVLTRYSCSVIIKQSQRGVVVAVNSTKTFQHRLALEPAALYRWSLRCCTLVMGRGRSRSSRLL